jgi:uncharacterized membrane protein YhaH (DUF805 family)
MLARLLTGWTMIRALYAIIGLWILAQSIVDQQWIVTLFGLYFASMGLFGFGCAGGTCYANYSNPAKP